MLDILKGRMTLPFILSMVAFLNRILIDNASPWEKKIRAEYCFICQNSAKRISFSIDVYIIIHQIAW